MSISQKINSGGTIKKEALDELWPVDIPKGTLPISLKARYEVSRVENFENILRRRISWLARQSLTASRNWEQTLEYRGRIAEITDLIVGIKEAAKLWKKRQDEATKPPEEVAVSPYGSEEQLIAMEIKAEQQGRELST